MSTPSPNRLVSLDVFRGMTIAGMTLVNNPGTWSAIYWPLEHAEWNGWTPTDLVFPFFLFIVGVSITLSLGRRLEAEAPKGPLYTKAVKRALIIFGLGFFLNLFPHFHFPDVRIPGVLQRIAVCYLITAFIFLSTKLRTQAIIAVLLLILYWLVMTTIAAPGYEAGDLTKEGSLASYVDRVVFGAHV
ncbi:MAG TPA: heparan-alpha-glucosaminide N-acetyltransferase domain-containing protein, partial [Pyrinomonadaceae bacterium]|nr:heparan-alpha-glucosaminide N-acetyltransferase domain-containing protein [Pyrinomonadaceae bacterium]